MDDAPSQQDARSFEVRAAMSGLRLDQFLARLLPDYSRAFLQNLIDGGHATVNGEVCRRSQRVQFGDQVTIVPAIAGGC